jgi:hypothetical protein
MVEAFGTATINDVRKTIDKPWNTVIPQLDALHLLGVLSRVELEAEAEDDDTEDSKPKTKRTIKHYSLAETMEPNALRLTTLLPHKSTYGVLGVIKGNAAAAM